MNLFSIPTVLLALFFSTHLQADQSRSTYSHVFWQPDSGQNGILVGGTQAILKAKFAGTTSGITYDGDLSGNSKSLGAEYQRGLSDFISIGLGTSWGESSSKTKINLLGTSSESNINSEGPGDIRIFLKGRNTMGSSGAFYFGLGFSASPGDHTRDAGTEKSNNFSGGTATIPYLGLHFSASQSVFIGGQVGYDLRGERKTKTSNPTSETITTGGNSLTVSAFVEFPLVNMHPTFLVGYSKPEKTINTTGSTPTEIDGLGTITAQASGELNVGSDFKILPMLGYATITEKNLNGGTYESFDMYLLSLMGRLTF